MNTTLVHHFLERSAEACPERPAIWYEDRWMSYGDIDVLADKVAEALKTNGVKTGDRVALLSENSFDYVIAYYGILKAGAITVALNTDTTSSSLVYHLNHSGARVLIASRRYRHFVAPALAEAPEIELLITDKKENKETERDVQRPRRLSLPEIYAAGKTRRPDILGSDLAVASIVYTSGSTGRPKGVTLSHLNIVSNTRSIVDYLGLTSSDRIMVVLPFSYIYGKSLLNTHFSVSGSVVIDNRFSFPQTVLETMQKTEVTGFAGVPSTFLILLNKSAVRKFRFPALRYVTQAGGPMASSLQKDVARIFAPAKLVIMYGATEASARLSYLDPGMLPQKWGSIGKAIPGVELFIADEQGRKLPQGQTGEIVARGPNIMIGYWNDPQATAEAIRNGFYFTGDLGYEDEEGFLFVTGRSKDIIKPGGFRVGAREVEDAICRLNGVEEAAVIGVEDPVLGEAVKAYVVARKEAGWNADQVKKALSKVLPPFKQPKHVEFCEALPKNESGKVLKSVLKAQTAPESRSNRS